MKITRAANSKLVPLENLNLGECYTVGEDEKDVYVRGEEKRMGHGFSTRCERYILVTRLHDGRQGVRRPDTLVTRVEAELIIREVPHEC